MPEIKGDYGGILKTIKCNADAKLETVSAIEAGSAIIGNIDRVATVGDIAHLGSIANTMFDIGTAGRVIRVDTLGTVERVKVVDNLGTVGRLETIGMIEAGTISEVTHVGTIGDITHLGSIGNTSFDQGSVSDHKREMYGWDETDWEKVRTDTGGKLKTAPATSRKGGKKLVTNMGTAVALVASSTPCISVIVKALHTNAGEVYVGDNTVGSATGYPLQKDEFVSFSCDNVNGVYIDRNAGTQGVSFLYVNY